MLTKPRDAIPGDAAEILESVLRHRLLTTSQVLDLHLPGKSLRTAQLVLSKMARAGLLSSVRPGSRAEVVWYATELGAQAAGPASARPFRVTAAAAAGPWRAHTLAINDVGRIFVSAARQLGHECHPADWEHEVALRVTDRRAGAVGSDLVVVDAVLHYARRFPEGDELMVRFLELDRGTETVQRLAAKLVAYRQLYAYRPKSGPGWRDRYLVFPKVLVVLAGSLSPYQLARRRDTFLQLAEQTGIAETITAMAVTWPDLERQGPFAPVFWAVGGAAHAVDFAGEAPDQGLPVGPVDQTGRRGHQLRLIAPAREPGAVL